MVWSGLVRSAGRDALSVEIRAQSASFVGHQQRTIASAGCREAASEGAGAARRPDILFNPELRRRATMRYHTKLSCGLQELVQLRDAARIMAISAVLLARIARTSKKANIAARLSACGMSCEVTS